jgi:hypothetical protein
MESVYQTAVMDSFKLPVNANHAVSTVTSATSSTLRNALLALPPTFYTKDNVSPSALMDSLTAMENATLALKDATFATTPSLAKNVFLHLAFPMIKEPVLLPAQMVSPPDKEDALLAMLTNVKHAIPLKSNAKNASFPELY